MVPVPYILVVEDETMLHLLLEAQLKPLGLAVVVTNSPSSALAIAKVDTPTLAVLDMNNPEMHGNDLARKLWEMYPSLPVLFISGGNDRPALDEERTASFLSKPFRAENIQAACKELLCPTSTTTSTGP